MTPPALLFQGAESRAYATEYLGLAAVMKERFRKKYRHPVLDEELTKARIRSEVRHLAKARAAGIPVPYVLAVSLDAGTIHMERVEGEMVSKVIAEGRLPVEELASKVGVLVCRLHDADIVHGDITTSNMILTPTNEIYLIDFGLSSTSTNIEHRAVDLNVFERSIRANHADIAELFVTPFRHAYAAHSSLGKNTVARLEAAVAKRGRKRPAQ